MKFNFTTAKVLVGNALRTLGITESLGKTLAADQKDAIKKAYGDAFTEKFEASLGAEDPETFVADMHAAMKAFFAPEANAATEEVVSQLNAARQVIATQNQTIATLMETPEDAPVAETGGFEGKSGIAKVLNVNNNATHYAAALTVLNSGSMLHATGATIDVGDLRKEFGTYLSQNGTNLSLIKQLFQGFTSSKYFKSVPALTEYRAIQSHINSVVQQFTPRWTPQGNTKFTPLTIKNFRHKINVPIVPAETLDSYIFHLYDEGLAPAQMPITKYIWDELVNPAMEQDLETRMVFKGKYVENLDPNAPSAPEDSMDGIETILVEQKALGVKSKINFSDQTIDWESATDEEVIAFFEKFVDKIKPLYKTKKMNLYCSPDVLTIYQRAYKNVWGQNSGQDGDFGTKRIDFSNVTVVALDGMIGSPIVFSTPDNNMVKLRHKNEVPNIVNKVVETHYTVDIVGEFWLGVGFVIAEGVFAYVPDGYDPQAALADFLEFPDGTTPGGTTPGGASSAGSGSEGGGLG